MIEIKSYLDDIKTVNDVRDEDTCTLWEAYKLIEKGHDDYSDEVRFEIGRELVFRGLLI